MSPATRDLLDRETALASRFPGLNTSREQAVLVLEAGPDQALAVLQHLKDDPSLAFAQLTDLTAVDYPERGQLVLVYRLTHLPEYDTVVVKVALPREAPEAPSVSRLWHNAV
jgi:NADH:ubiquinone oxidoreductase subunit C